MKQWPKLSEGETIHLWVCQDVLSSCLDGGLSVLSTEEQERALGYRFEKDRRRYLGGVLLQRVVLAHYSSRPLEELSFVRNEWGKPSLLQGEEAKIWFSLSRSQDVAILAVSGRSEIGADVEFNSGGEDLGVRSQFSEAEQEFIKNTPDSVEAFFEIWARKEAYIKGIGRGLTHPLDQFDVSQSDVGDWSKSPPSGSWNVRSVELPFRGYAAAIATLFPHPTIEIIELSRDELLAGLG